MENKPPCDCEKHAPPDKSPLPSLRTWKRLLGAVVAIVAVLTILSAFIANQIAIYAPEAGVKPPELGSIVGELSRLLMVFLGGG